ncbi:acetyltransferase, GNAT family [Leptospira inadai serovar Lyme str. 10]|uniref:Acetyltransferase, GNAT family n=2 Tax=Leptospira inadai serovar Lyme TaxID=293084 RepID=V6HDL3_9LEPT|nr:GNAT family N-acetyltransferase [Leptospira inadai]EQA37213.1 acetyltransferase, GNAT family [Leptospira inadai serovar Lyme str. 10]PNV75032.1 GNAT family N-acetyltransferase [Leptospira inadai serovar Lyme]
MPFGKKKILSPGWREANITDVEYLSMLEKLCFPDSHWSKDGIESHIKSYSAWLREEFGYMFFLDLGEEGELLRIGILSSQRRKGEAKRILQTLCFAFQRVFLEVSNFNISAMELYSSLGFREIGRRKNYYAFGDDAIIMEWSRRSDF